MNTPQPGLAKPIKVPGPDHPIEIEAARQRITVTVAGMVIADTKEALVLREANYPPVHYVPRRDVNMALLVPTEERTYCPYKGDCNYFSIPLGGAQSVNAVWTYEQPYPAVAAIKEFVAFYPGRVEAINESPL